MRPGDPVGLGRRATRGDRGHTALDVLAGSEAGIPEAVAAWSRLDEDLSIDDFWTTRSLVELAEAQGVDVVVDVETLQDESVSDEEAEAFIRALGL